MHITSGSVLDISFLFLFEYIKQNLPLVSSSSIYFDLDNIKAHSDIFHFILLWSRLSPDYLIFIYEIHFINFSICIQDINPDFVTHMN